MVGKHRKILGIFFFLPFYFPVFMREKDIPASWEKNNRNG